MRVTEGKVKRNKITAAAARQKGRSKVKDEEPHKFSAKTAQEFLRRSINDSST
jgi:hypothetical protein